MSRLQIRPKASVATYHGGEPEYDTPYASVLSLPNVDGVKYRLEQSAPRRAGGAERRVGEQWMLTERGDGDVLEVVRTERFDSVCTLVGETADGGAWIFELVGNGR